MQGCDCGARVANDASADAPLDVQDAAVCMYYVKEWGRSLTCPFDNKTVCGVGCDFECLCGPDLKLAGCINDNCQLADARVCCQWLPDGGKCPGVGTCFP